MGDSKCCGTAANEQKSGDYEIVAIERTERTCPLCENYTKQQASKSIAVICCEGACLRGEVARRAADLVCHQLAPDRTARVCLGSAFTKDAGQRNLVRDAQKVVALEGCFIECASRMMKAVVSDLDPQVIVTDALSDFDPDKTRFGTEELTPDQVHAHARVVAKKVVAQL